MEQLDELFDGVRSTIRRLQDENNSLRAQLTAQRLAFEREIASLNRKSIPTTIPPLRSPTRLKYNSATTKMDQEECMNMTFDQICDVDDKHGKLSSRSPPNSNRYPIEMETGDGINISLSRSMGNSNSVSGITKPASPSHASLLTQIISSPERLPSKLQKTSVSLPRRVTDLEFFRLPTQYSDSLLSSQAEISPRKIPRRSPSPEIDQEEHSNFEMLLNNDDDIIEDSEEEEILTGGDIHVELGVQSMKDFASTERKKEEAPKDGRPINVEGVDRPPLQDISNASKLNASKTNPSKINPSKMTTLQKREATRHKLYKLLDQGHSIDLTINPVYAQSWKLTDFEPNPEFIKPKLKRKRGKTTKEQQDIDKFYKLAGPGIHLKSLKWNDGEEEPFEEVNPEFSQYYDRFPSPPGFNDVEFPTTQEEIQRRQYTEQMQQNRIQNRLELALQSATGGKAAYMFREPIIRQYVKMDRYVLKR